VQIVLGLMQIWWDRTEPNGWVPYMRRDMRPGTPPHEVLIHVAIGDHQVTPLGAVNLRPTNRDVFGIDGADGPRTTSTMVESSFGLHPAPLENYPPDPTLTEDPHGKVRLLEPTYLQEDNWFKDGVIAPFCDGPCDPT
jgi:hypothetical protein